MYYRMHEVESEPRIYDDLAMSMPISTSSEMSLSSNNKQTNDDLQKIRKYFPETWLWNSTITGYAMQ